MIHPRPALQPPLESGSAFSKIVGQRGRFCQFCHTKGRGKAPGEGGSALGVLRYTLLPSIGSLVGQIHRGGLLMSSFVILM